MLALRVAAVMCCSWNGDNSFNRCGCPQTRTKIQTIVNISGLGGVGPNDAESSLRLRDVETQIQGNTPTPHYIHYNTCLLESRART